MFLARSGAALLTGIVSVAVPTLSEAVETSCKSWLFGICTERHTAEEQAKIDAEERLRALLRDPARAAPELERRLRQEVRYHDGVLLIEEPIMHGVVTVPATAGWSISCDTLGIEVSFGGTSENGSASVQLTPIGIGADPSTCRGISAALGTAVLRLTRGD